MAIQKDATLSGARRWRREHMETVLGLQREVAVGGLDLMQVRQRIVDAAMEISGGDAAVVEEPEGEELVYRAVAGTAGESLGIHLPMANTLSGMSFQTREVLRTDDTASDPRVELKEAARQIGFISGLLIPLIHQNDCYGVLKVYSSERSRFGDEDRQLLELASSILASALFNAASFDEELRRRSELLDSIPMLVSYVDRDRRYQEVNAAYEEWFEIEAASIRGRRIEDVLGRAAYERIYHHVDAALRGEPVSFEATLTYRRGGERTVLAQYRSHFSRRGEVLGFYAVVSDLTQLKQAEQDFLTGLWNRRKCEEKADEMLQMVARYDHTLSLLMLDVDHFKNVNDRYGHLCGDDVLKDLGEYLNNTVRGVDVVGRWGGEEFIILAPETDVAEAQLLAERICSEIRQQTFGGLDNVTISIGVTQASKGESLEQILGRTDAALYRAKGEGRDRVVVAETGAG